MVLHSTCTKNTTNPRMLCAVRTFIEGYYHYDSSGLLFAILFLAVLLALERKLLLKFKSEACK